MLLRHIEGTMGTADGATAASASATDTGADVDTDPTPAATAPPTAERISSFLLHIRRHVADNATASVASAAPVLATPPSPYGTVGTAEGATATAAPAAGTDMAVDTDAIPAAAADDADASAASSPDVVVGTTDNATETVAATTGTGRGVLPWKLEPPLAPRHRQDASAVSAQDLGMHSGKEESRRQHATAVHPREQQRGARRGAGVVSGGGRVEGVHGP